MLAVTASAVVVVVALTVGGVVLFSGDGKTDPEAHDTLGPSPRVTTAGPEPARTRTPTSTPQETGPSGGFRVPTFEDSMPTPSSGPRYAFQLDVGDCFDTSEATAGKGEPVDCSGPHDAEVVTRRTLPDGLETDQEIRDKAGASCKSSLRDKAHAQPRGTMYQTLVQFPAVKGFDLGMRTVTCSLTADKGKRLDGPLD